MANIIITNRAGIYNNGKIVVPSYFEGLLQSLIAQGNNVLHFLTSDFLTRDFNGTNEPYSKSLKVKMLDKAKNFDPDLVISFNNSSISGIDKVLECPIILWEADSVQFFNDKSYIKENSDRYHYVAISSSSYKDCKELLSAKNDKIARVMPATAVRKKDEEKRYNVSFIGNPFYNNPKLERFLKNYPEYRSCRIETVRSIMDFDEKFGKKYAITKLDIANNLPCYNRGELVFKLKDCGVKVFGPLEWVKNPVFGSKLREIYDPRLVYSLKQNELIYNRSNVSLNINHSQAKTGYSWRVADILASSSTLLTNYSPDLEADFAGMKLPTFRSSDEAFELTKKLLKNPSWRDDLVAQCNEEIERKHRWHHCFPVVEDLTGVKLSQKPERGNYERFQHDILDVRTCRDNLMVACRKGGRVPASLLLARPKTKRHSLKYSVRKTMLGLKFFLAKAQCRLLQKERELYE